MAPTTEVQRALTTYLPTLKTVPPRLTSLTSSLLSQSRQRAPHLKQDEELGRVCACAEIACDRLRAPLRLPPIKKTGVPCNPKTYKKLLTYLAGILDKETTTPRKRKAEDVVTPAKAEVGPETPSKRQKTTTPVSKRGSTFVGTVKAGASKGKKAEAPSFVMPAVRELCKAYGTNEMAPHVYTGACVALRLAELWPRPADEKELSKDFEADVTYMVVALYLMTLTRMQRGKMTTKILRGVSSRAVEVFEALSGTKKIEAWIKRINKEGYCKGQDWWDSVPEEVLDFSLDAVDLVQGENEAPTVDDVEDDELVSSRRTKRDLEEDDPEGVLLTGLGTMMQDAVDWLSAEKKAAFRSWKQDMLKKLDRMDKKSKTGRAVVVN